MIKAVIFDCFGVLTTDGWLPFKRKYFSNDPTLETEATDLNKRTDAGLATYDDFVQGIARLAHVSEGEATKAIENNVTDDDLLDFIEHSIKPHYKVGMLSNAGDNWLPKLFSKKQISLFDAVALSYETGFVKPDPQAYRVICERLGLEPENCVFIDDQERYCLAAKEQGMKAIWYQSFEQFKSEINPFIGITKQR